jgi:hypothetical protein
MSSGRPALDAKFVYNSFKKEGYELLTKSHINAHRKLYYICPNGHKHSIRWYNWRKGKRCYYCHKYKFSIEYVRKAFEEENYILLSDEYHNTETKLGYICPEGHRHSITWQKWQQGRRCPICYYLRISGKNHYNWKGGVTYDPYCDVWKDRDFKKSILERDNYQCQNPDCWETSERLSVHHVNYNKKDCRPKNLITLCNSCNSRANFNREWQEIYYTEIMVRRGLNGGMACLDYNTTEA